MMLVVREDEDGLRRYMHFGTGNYNEKTARLYTDISLFTCRPELGADDTQLFNALTGFSKVTDYEELWVAPVTLHRELIARIERETEHARAGRPARDSRQDQRDHRCRRRPRALSRLAGRRADRAARARHVHACGPACPGVSENIRVRSIVGRFLEHSRIFVFENGGEQETSYRQRRLDGPQSRSARRAGRSGARSGYGAKHHLAHHGRAALR